LAEDCQVEDVAQKHYQEQMDRLREEQRIKDSERSEEIAQLKRLLEQSLNEQEMKNKSLEQDLNGQEKLKPIVQEVDLNGIRTNILICSFKAEDGRVGLQVKRYGTQFFVTGVLPGLQASRYQGIAGGLLIYQVVSSKPGKATGRSMSVRTAAGLAQAVIDEFQKGRIITMKFLIPPQGIPVHTIYQEVLRIPKKKKVVTRIVRSPCHY
jgi:hypothetical protein